MDMDDKLAAKALPFSNEQSDSFPSPATHFPAVSEHHSAGVQSRTGDAHSVPLSNTFTRIDVPVNETWFRLNATANDNEGASGEK